MENIWNKHKKRKKLPHILPRIVPLIFIFRWFFMGERLVMKLGEAAKVMGGVGKGQTTKEKELFLKPEKKNYH